MSKEESKINYRYPKKNQRSINLEVNVQMKEDGLGKGETFFKAAQIRVGPPADQKLESLRVT